MLQVLTLGYNDCQVTYISQEIIPRDFSFICLHPFGIRAKEINGRESVRATVTMTRE